MKFQPYIFNISQKIRQTYKKNLYINIFQVKQVIYKKMTELMERQGWQPLTRNIEQGKSPILCDSMKIGKILDSKVALLP